MRAHCNDEELGAHEILDSVKAGIDASSETIARALWVLGDAHGMTNIFEDTMKPLHINQARCHGRDTKPNGAICPHRSTCQRHTQLDVDRDMGLIGDKRITVMNKPFIDGQDCHYRMRVVK